MLVDKQQLLDLIAQQGSPEQLALAQVQLPAQVDVTQYAGMLQGFGLDPQSVAGLVSGGADAGGLVDQVTGGDAGGILSRIMSLFGG